MKYFFSFLSAFFLLIFSSCNSGEQNVRDSINKRISTMSRVAELGTTEYTISKIIKAEDKAFYKIGERKILFSCKAYLKSGIDLKNFSTEDVKYDEASNTIIVMLPEPQLLSFNMPSDKVNLEYVNVGTFRSDFSVEERNALLKQGEESIRADIENIGIIEDARQNAVSFFKSLFSFSEVKNVKIEFKK